MKSQDTVSATWPPGATIQLKPMENGHIQLALKHDGHGSSIVLDPAQAMWVRDRIGEIYKHTKGRDNYGS